MDGAGKPSHDISVLGCIWRWDGVLGTVVRVKAGVSRNHSSIYGTDKRFTILKEDIPLCHLT